MSITHTTVAAGANDPTKEVSSDAWNDDHAIALADGDIPTTHSGSTHAATQAAAEATASGALSTHAALPNVHHAEAHTVHASIQLGAGGATITTGTGTPEGSVTATPGSLYLRTTGVSYVKASGTGNTGWVEMVTFS